MRTSGFHGRWASAVVSLESATKLILDTKHTSFRNVARVRSEASGYWRTETLPFLEPGVRLLPQNKLAGFDARMSQPQQELLGAARELSGQYEQIKNESRRRLGTLFNPSDYPATLDWVFDRRGFLVPGDLRVQGWV